MDSGSILPSSVEIDFRRIPTTNLRTPTGSIIPHILLWVVQLVALASNPFRGRGTLFAGAIICLAILSQINPHFTNNIALAQPFTIGWSNYLSTLEKLLFCAEGKPEASFWHVDKPAQEALSFPGFGYRKIRWALVIILNMRGIRWNYQVKNIPKANLRSRSAFVVSQIYNIMYYGLMADLVIHLGIRFFFTAGDGQVGVLNSKYLTLRHPDWRWSFVKALVFGASPYYVCCLQYTMFSVPAVLLGLSKPEDWPPIFGSLKDATTVRGFWGKYWHQTIRKLLTAYTGAFVDALGIKRGTNLSSYTQLWLAFAISGCMHANSMLGLPSPANVTLSERTIGMIQFFLWQATAISFEDLIQWLWARSLGEYGGPETFRRVVGWSWVIGSFWYSLPFAGDVMIRMRLGEETFLPFSVVQPWLKNVPIPL